MKRILVTSFYKYSLNLNCRLTISGNRFGKHRSIHIGNKQVSARTGFLIETFNSTRFQGENNDNNPYSGAR